MRTSIPGELERLEDDSEYGSQTTVKTSKLDTMLFASG